MKGTRKTKGEEEGPKNFNIYKKSKLLDVTSNLIDLCNLPLDILNFIIIQKTSLLEKHILSFVCKKLHNTIHRFYYFLTRSASTKFHNSEKFDELAAKCGNVNIFKWVVSTFGKGNSHKVCYNAARYGGNLDLIKYVRSIGYPWNELVSYGAVKGGTLEILKWAVENNCSRYTDTCSEAAKGGHFEALRAALVRNTKMGQKK
jgi:hypothetical protein